MRLRVLRYVAWAGWFGILTAAAAGCSGCQERELLPRAPVEGKLPLAPGLIKRPATPAHPACAVLAFPSADRGPAPLLIQMEAQGDCSEGEVIFSWDFGDGTPPATGALLNHTFEKPGSYHVKVTATSSVNKKLQDSDDFKVVVQKPPA